LRISWSSCALRAIWPIPASGLSGEQFALEGVAVPRNLLPKVLVAGSLHEPASRYLYLETSESEPQFTPQWKLFDIFNWYNDNNYCHKLKSSLKIPRLIKMSLKSDTYDHTIAEVEQQLREHSAFSGSGEELLRLVAELASSLQLTPEDDSGNERLLRHYASVNVVDKPSRQGRDAVYTYRHLLQFLAARRLLKQGFSLSKIAEFTSVVPTGTLQQTLCESPRHSEAELLVAAYSAARAAPLAPAVKRSEPIYGIADLMNEIEKMRTRFVAEIQHIQSQMSLGINTLEKTSRILDRLQVDSAKNLHWVLEEKKDIQEQLEQRLLQLIDMTVQSDGHTRQMLHEISKRSDLLERRIAEITNAIEKLRFDCSGSTVK
jgi:DNA-binding transcriptional MerR regulator